MYIFESNEQLIKRIKILFMEEDTSAKKVAEKIGTSQQNISKKLNKKSMDFDTLHEILDAMGYDLEFNFKKRES